jgi:hypothetical protein
MSGGAELVPVRVLPERALSLRDGQATVSHRAGDELELEAAGARELIRQGFVERLKG